MFRETQGTSLQNYLCSIIGSIVDLKTYFFNIFNSISGRPRTITCLLNDLEVCEGKEGFSFPLRKVDLIRDKGYDQGPRRQKTTFPSSLRRKVSEDVTEVPLRLVVHGLRRLVTSV